MEFQNNQDRLIYFRTFKDKLKCSGISGQVEGLRLIHLSRQAWYLFFSAELNALLK